MSTRRFVITEKRLLAFNQEKQGPSKDLLCDFEPLCGLSFQALMIIVCEADLEILMLSVSQLVS